MNTAVRASIWSIYGFGASQLRRLVANLVLTRLLVPEAFGLMAIVTILIVGLAMCTDVGTNASIIQNKRGEEGSFSNTAWSMKVIRGFVTAALLFLFSEPIAPIIANNPLVYPSPSWQFPDSIGTNN